MSAPVLIKGSNGITPVSIESKHMSDRRLFLTGEINADSALDFMKQVMYLNAEDEKAPISVFINSQGGEIDNGLLIYDVIVGSKAPIHMFCAGCAYSMGAVLFVCGKERYMLPHSKLMLHEPLLGGKIGGNASSIKSISDSLLETKIMMNKLLAQHSGKSEEEIDMLTSYDHYFTAQEAMDMGLSDGIKSFKEMMEVCL
ncbi:ATP-dependent Clp protease proteolytic subunit [Frisingicoccus caecimuris]|uniref:ATP-dependent Clp protease proteolytic subunit n=1 Tax=Frisingicoccus caecimuris TaxID=1796636 RepID=A0A4R2LEG7_9FIRM|nr:ATP-dependent Clp protease proteolytic subunit [Frisingicoccus caecimuris]MCR1918249.1 ATP-dependent Clp protease proteolytic subunit [Frisingicoccus caecimuris]TCO85334.1 ATP-dependent Clp protease protease subunit [Frisingicoccus caecimuris]